MLLLSGATFDDFKKPKCAYAFQQFVIRSQMQLEDSFENYARAAQGDSVILCDRGTMDGAAYMDSKTFSKLLHEVGQHHSLQYFTWI
jgi:hypothetical protein